MNRPSPQTPVAMVQALRDCIDSIFSLDEQLSVLLRLVADEDQSVHDIQEDARGAAVRASRLLPVGAVPGRTRGVASC